MRKEVEEKKTTGKGKISGRRSGMCGDRNVWNPNCVIAPEQTLVLPVIPQTAGSELVCVCVRRAKRHIEGEKIE